MKKLNDIWVPKNKVERWGVIIGVWFVAGMLMNLSNGNEAVVMIVGVPAIAVTIYSLTQGTKELKEIDTKKREVNKGVRDERYQQRKIDKKESKIARLKQEANNRTIKRGRDPETGQLACPKCGNTQLSANKKGLSWWKGLIGSQKVYITCMQCGNKWKAGKYK